MKVNKTATIFRDQRRMDPAFPCLSQIRISSPIQTQMDQLSCQGRMRMGLLFWAPTCCLSFSDALERQGAVSC